MTSTNRSTSLRFRLGLISTVVFAVVSISGQAFAQAAVVDIPHTVKTTFGWIAQYEQMISDYEQQLNQYKTLVKQYEQAQVNGISYKGKPGYRETFKERDINEGVDKRCAQAHADKSAAPEQYNNCVAIVQMENGRYNAMVKTLEGVKDRDKELKEAMAERDSIGQDEQGKLESNSNRILALQSQLQNDMQNSQTLLTAYDASIENLKDKQVLAANRALNGESSLLGDATQGVALKLALKAARMRDR